MNALASHFGSIRARITFIATLAVAMVLTVFAITLLLLVQRELVSNLDNSLEQRGDTLETSFTEENGDRLSVLLNSNDEDRAAQLIDANGVLIASTPNLDQPAFDADTGGPGALPTFSSTRVPHLEDDNYRVLARNVDLPSGPAVLYVAQNIDDLNDTVRGVKIGLGVSVPVVVILLAALVWLLVGRTLRPVELMRADAADISGTDLTRRLPVPEQADEIARLASTMNQMLDRIDHAGRRQRQFVADASHELRTPLTRIRTEIEVDLNRPDLANPAATNTTILEEAITLQHLLDDLLFLARSDEHQHTSKRQPTDLDDLVLREIHNLRSDTGIRWDTSELSGAHLDADPGQLSRVVRNLLSNAARHARTTVHVTLEERRDIIRLTVADDGPGVPNDARERIFERFGRVDDARTRATGGTGLGLAIVRDIVHRHHGEIRYDNAWAAGARFIVELPMTSSETAASPERSKT